MNTEGFYVSALLFLFGRMMQMAFCVLRLSCWGCGIYASIVCLMPLNKFLLFSGHSSNEVRKTNTTQNIQETFSSKSWTQTSPRHITYKILLKHGKKRIILWCKRCSWVNAEHRVCYDIYSHLPILMIKVSSWWELLIKKKTLVLPGGSTCVWTKILLDTVSEFAVQNGHGRIMHFCWLISSLYVIRQAWKASRKKKTIICVKLLSIETPTHNFCFIFLIRFLFQHSFVTWIEIILLSLCYLQWSINLLIQRLPDCSGLGDI